MRVQGIPVFLVCRFRERVIYRLDKFRKLAVIFAVKTILFRPFPKTLYILNSVDV
jgi:hypothetical protein